MISVLRYGIDSSLRLELAPEVLVANCDAPRGEPLTHVAEATSHALAGPLDFPSLSLAAVPGDKVALALEAGVPQAAAIVGRVVEVLIAAGVDAADITVIRTGADLETGAADPIGQLSEDVRSRIGSQVHKPGNRESLSYLGASTDAKPIYINRIIHDADLVISIGCLRLSDSPGYYGIHTGVFPTFSEAASLDRYRSAKLASPTERKRLATLVEEVSWLLGVRFSVQVVPGAGSDVLHVLAGDAAAVFRAGSQLCEDAWTYWVPHRADLVVATIEGDATQQTWDNVARALFATSHVVREEGAVAICTELAQKLGPGLQRIVGDEDLDAVLSEIRQYHPSDALQASEVVHALQRGKVYLVSRLDDELVEELGMSPVTGEQVSRLASRYGSCILLGNAQYAMARPRLEDHDEVPAVKGKLRK